MGGPRVATTGVFAVLAALGLGGSAPAAALEPGVQIDPGSPAAKEYALPLNQARRTGSREASSSQGESSKTLFGAGIKPPSGGSSTPLHSHRARAHPSAAAAVLPAAVRASRSASSSSGGDSSTLVLIGGGVLVLVLGGFGGTVLRHSRRPTPTA
jgi:hypothetical protein